MNVKLKRHIKQILPFVFISTLFGLVYASLEVGILGASDYYPSTGNQYDFKSSFFIIFGGSIFLGILQGTIEILWLKSRFVKKAIWIKVIEKSVIHISLIIFFLIIITVFNGMYSYNEGVFGPTVKKELLTFITAFSFWSVVIYAGLGLILALLLSEMGAYLGDDLFYNFLLGKYHRPNLEKRIFMFLDMKGSTTIAEDLGHDKYFELLKSYYADMTNPILETSGEVYQYVGDEIVVSWIEKKGLYKGNCLECFKRISDNFDMKKGQYLKQFGVAPEFKAGFHIGEVTSGEIGIIKRDIIYTGDILNTTARIQSQCNAYKAKGLISSTLVEALPKKDSFRFDNIGNLTLRGKKNPIELYSINFL